MSAFQAEILFLNYSRGKNKKQKTKQGIFNKPFVCYKVNHDSNLFKQNIIT